MKTENFTPFFGVVEDVNDPEQLGRVRVRCYGYHTDKKESIPSNDLHWFSTIVSNSSGVSGKGDSPTGYVTGATVFGFFIDTFYQNGIVLGSFTGKPVSLPNINRGFNDPEGLFPNYVNESDVNRLARGDQNHYLFGLRSNARYEQIQKPFRKGVYAEPEYANQAKYPFNHVFESKKGHIKEVDDTEGGQRLHEYHISGSYDETVHDGSRTIKIVGDGYEIIAGNKFLNVRGDVNMTVEGNLNQYVKGDYNLQVDGSKTEVVQGSVKEYFVGGQTTASNGGVAIDGSTVNLNSGVANGNKSLPITLAKEYDVTFARPVLIAAGRNAALDTENEITSTPEDYPEDDIPDSFDGTAKQESELVDEEKTVESLPSCITIIDEDIDYSQRLGNTSFSIGDLSRNALFSHDIQAQAGLTEQEIVCNLEGLATNILQPLSQEYGSFRINSGFRVGSGRSQHNTGEAVDIQNSSWSYEKYLEVAEWIAENLPIDQLIFEHGNSIWLHISFDSSSTTQRGQLLTMLDGAFESGIKLYY